MTRPKYDVTVDARRPRDELVAELQAVGMPLELAEANADLCAAYVEGHPDEPTLRLRFEGPVISSAELVILHALHNLPDGDLDLVLPAVAAPAIAAALRTAAFLYDRAVLVDVLIYHTRNGIEGCHCGWAELGGSWPEHVATVYEESVMARASA